MEKVNRSWVLCTAAAGVVLVLFAIVADVWWDLNNIVPSAFLEMGAAALMAAVLFFVVPHFTAGVADAVMDQMTAGVAPHATAATGTDPEEARAAWETTFLRALDDIDADQLRLLERFTQNAEQLRLAPPGRDGHFMEALDESQLRRISSDVVDLPAALAALQRHGLLATRVLEGGPDGGGTTYWIITGFGTRFVDRLQKIREVGASPRP